MPSWKVKVLGLNSRKATKWLNIDLNRFQYLLNLLHSWRIWHLVSIEYTPHRQLKSSLRKNLNQYSPIGAWFVIALMALAHNKLEWPSCLIHGPVRVANIGLKIILLSFSFSFSFWFTFYFWELELEFSVTLYTTVTNGYIVKPSVTHQSHNHISQWKIVEGSGRNDII